VSLAEIMLGKVCCCRLEVVRSERAGATYRTVGASCHRRTHAFLDTASPRSVRVFCERFLDTSRKCRQPQKSNFRNYGRESLLKVDGNLRSLVDYRSTFKIPQCDARQHPYYPYKYCTCTLTHGSASQLNQLYCT